MKSSRSATTPEHRHIVLVPGLEAMLRESASVPRPISRLLGQAEERSLDPASCHSQLLFGQALPAAALSRHLDRPEDVQGSWLRADPAGVRPDLGAVWLQPGSRLSPDSPAGRDLAARFAEEGMRLELTPSGRGYLTLRSVPECRFTPPWQLAGESMDRVWPQGRDALYWRNLLNETQMILHQHRQSNPELPGTLWFWGAGESPANIPQARVCRVRAKSPELLGASRWAGLDCIGADAGGDAGTWPGLLVEWISDHALTAEDNLARLAADLVAALRRLRFARNLRELELASENRAWCLSTPAAWRVW